MARDVFSENMIRRMERFINAMLLIEKFLSRKEVGELLFLYNKLPVKVEDLEDYKWLKNQEHEFAGKVISIPEAIDMYKKEVGSIDDVDRDVLFFIWLFYDDCILGSPYLVGEINRYMEETGLPVDRAIEKYCETWKIGGAACFLKSAYKNLISL